MVEKGIRDGICQVIHRHTKVNNKCMKNYDKDTASLYLAYLDGNNFYGWTMAQKLPVNGFKWVEKSRLARFNERFVKKYNEIKIREKVGIDHHNDPRAYIAYSNDMHDVYKNINYYNPKKENKISIVFDDMIANMINNKKLNLIVTELFIRGRKLNIFLVFIAQSYFKVPKDDRLNTTHFFIAKTSNKRELREIAINHSSDISTKDFTNIYRKCTVEPYSFFS